MHPFSDTTRLGISPRTCYLMLRPLQVGHPRMPLVGSEQLPLSVVTADAGEDAIHDENDDEGNDRSSCSLVVSSTTEDENDTTTGATKPTTTLKVTSNPQREGKRPCQGPPRPHWRQECAVASLLPPPAPQPKKSQKSPNQKKGRIKSEKDSFDDEKIRRPCAIAAAATVDERTRTVAASLHFIMASEVQKHAQELAASGVSTFTASSGKDPPFHVPQLIYGAPLPAGRRSRHRLLKTRHHLAASLTDHSLADAAVVAAVESWLKSATAIPVELVSSKKNSRASEEEKDEKCWPLLSADTSLISDRFFLQHSTLQPKIACHHARLTTWSGLTFPRTGRGTTDPAFFPSEPLISDATNFDEVFAFSARRQNQVNQHSEGCFPDASSSLPTGKHYFDSRHLCDCADIPFRSAFDDEDHWCARAVKQFEDSKQHSKNSILKNPGLPNPEEFVECEAGPNFEMMKERNNHFTQNVFHHCDRMRLLCELCRPNLMETPNSKKKDVDALVFGLTRRAMTTVPQADCDEDDFEWLERFGQERA